MTANGPDRKAQGSYHRLAGRARGAQTPRPLHLARVGTCGDEGDHVRGGVRRSCNSHDHRVTARILPTETLRWESDARTVMACSPAGRSRRSKWKPSRGESKIESSGKICFQSPPSTEYSILAIRLSVSTASPETVTVVRSRVLPAREEVLRLSTRGGTLSMRKGALRRSVVIAVPSGLSGASEA